MPQFFTRNDHDFGFGRQLSYAGRNALREMLPGQFCTVATHSQRWKQFCAWSKTQNIDEAHQVNNQTLKHYAIYLRVRLEGQGKPLSVATAQNLLSTCNVVLKALRGNEDIKIKPSEALQANREKVRTEPPELSREKLAQAQAELILKGQERIAAVLGLCRLVPVSGYARIALSQAAKLQGSNDCLIPVGKRLENFLALVRMHSGPVLKNMG